MRRYGTVLSWGYSLILLLLLQISSSGQEELPSQKVVLGEKEGLRMEMYFDPAGGFPPKKLACVIQNLESTRAPFEIRGVTSGLIFRLFDRTGGEIPGRFAGTDFIDSPVGGRSGESIRPGTGLYCELDLEHTFGASWESGALLVAEWNPGNGRGLVRGRGLGGVLDLSSGKAIDENSPPAAKQAALAAKEKVAAAAAEDVRMVEAGKQGESGANPKSSPVVEGSPKLVRASAEMPIEEKKLIGPRWDLWALSMIGVALLGVIWRMIKRSKG